MAVPSEPDTWQSRDIGGPYVERRRLHRQALNRSPQQPDRRPRHRHVRCGTESVTGTTTIAVEFDLPFATPPNLDATMDIQIPALAWQPDPAGGYRRVLYLDGQPLVVTVREGDRGLHVTASRHHDELPGLLHHMFPIQVADLDLGTNSIWTRLQARYRGVIVMWAPPFEALVYGFNVDGADYRQPREIDLPWPTAP